MNNFTNFRAPCFSFDSTDHTASVESSALPVAQSPTRSPSFVLSSVNDNSSERSQSRDSSVSLRAPKNKHKLTKARAAALAIPLNGIKVGSSCIFLNILVDNLKAGVGNFG